MTEEVICSIGNVQNDAEKPTVRLTALYNHAEDGTIQLIQIKIPTE